MYETRRGRLKTYATAIKILIITIIVQNLETMLVYYCNSLDATTYFGYYPVILKKQLEDVSFWKFLHFSETNPFVGQCLHSLPVYLYETLCAIRYHLYNSNNLKNTYGGVLLLLKGYLRCKTMTSQNVSSEPQVKIFFKFFRKVPFLRYFSFCIFNHPMIYQICDVMMSIST